MDPRQIPTRWLMTDERLGDRLFEAIARVPAGGGVVLRHDSLAATATAELAREVAGRCRHLDLRLSVAGDAELAGAVGADFVHRPDGETRGLPLTLPVHDARQARLAKSRGAVAVFVSPLFATASHPERVAIGEDSAAELARLAGVPAIALGGMDDARFEGVRRLGFHGWAGIGAWLRI